MLKKILVVSAAALGVLAVVIAMRPSEFSVTRSGAISAPPAVVFAQVNNFRNWEAWSPWAKLDPDAKEIFEGPAEGEGAVFRWAGNKDVGEGSMRIIESRPEELVRIDLEFVKPFKGVSLTEFHFRPEGDRTIVAWTMSGKNNFMAKAIGLFMNCEKMIGGQFEQGLGNLKKTAEAAAVQKEPLIPGSTA